MKMHREADIHRLKFSFIIPALNESVMLSRLLTSINNMNTSTLAEILEIIVIDAESTDQTVSIAQSYNCKVHTAKPGRVSISRNIGAENASGDVLAFIDADCELPTDWLEKAAQELCQKQVIGVGFRMVENPNSSSWVEEAWYELAHKEAPNTETSEVDWLATFNLAIKKDAFKLAGGFDENLETCEDVELGYRLSTHGKLKRITSSGVIHHGESKTLSEFFRREAWRARGASGIVKKHWTNPRELLSFLLPMVFIPSLAASLGLFLFSLLGLINQEPSLAILFAAIFLGPLPILLLVSRRKVKLSRLLHCSGLLCVYFLARFQGTFKPFKRVER